MNGSRRLRKARVVLMSALMLSTLSGCIISNKGNVSKEASETEEIARKEVVKPDENTLHYSEVQSMNSIDKSELRGQTETQQKVDELNNSNSTDAVDEEVKQAIANKYAEHGITDGISYGQKIYGTESSFTITASADNTTLTVEGSYDGTNIEVYEAGASNGSEYVVMYNTKALHSMDMNDLSEVLLDNDIYSDVTIGADDGKEITISYNGETHYVNVETEDME